MLKQIFTPVRAILQNAVVESASPFGVGPYRSQIAGTGALVKVPLAAVAAFHTTPSVGFGRKVRKSSGSNFVPKEAVAEGEKSSFVEVRQARDTDRFPDLHLPTKLFNGAMFKDLPILNVKATMNNTIMNVTDSAGITHIIRSCGYDGFKNARKGTNVAAQATGFTLGKKMMQRGYRTVRARVQGLGPGRLASLRGITFAGVQIISITDNTPVSWYPPRPRKQRRL